jgi:hypothetical protein
VEVDDTARVAQASTDYTIHQFKDYVAGNTTIFNCKCQTNIACTQSTVYLQIYNHTSGEWDNLVSNNTAAANIDFDLIKEVPDLNNYKDFNNIVTCRVYQKAQ